MVLPNFILVPLYLYPSPGAWTFLTDSIAQYPNLLFNVVINPGNGPVNNGTTGYPFDDYINGIANLTAFNNARVLGYVDTCPPSLLPACREVSLVEADIQTYDHWSTYTPKNISIDGIFFDDGVATYTVDKYNYYSNITAFARNTSDVSKPFYPVVFNPGTLSDPQYFDIADEIVQIEESWATYETGNNDVTKIDPAHIGNSSIIIHDFTGTADQQATLVNTTFAAGINGLFVTTRGADEGGNPYNVSSLLWTQFVQAVNLAVNGS